MSLQRPISRPEGDAYHRMLYDRQLWKNKFLGVEILKNPFDLWVYQEIIFETRPTAIIETGTFAGGSAFFLAHTLAAAGLPDTKVFTIDIDDAMSRPSHPSVVYLKGSSIDKAMVSHVRGLAVKDDAAKIMVILDSHHTRDHVFAELNAYASMVGAGMYLIVEDTNIHGHPVLPNVYGAMQGPYEAVEKFLPKNPQFQRDPWRERFGISFNPGGYLKRVS